jgi:hypothetical protein
LLPLQSERNNTIRAHYHPSALSPPTSFNGYGESPYVRLNAQTMRPYDLHQAYLNRDGTYVYTTRQEQAKHLEAAADTIALNLSSHLHNSLLQGKDGVKPIEHLEASSICPYHLYSTYHPEDLPKNNHHPTGQTTAQQ